MRIRIVLAFLLIVPLLLAGCWGSRETDELAYVLAMGFDKGEKNNLLVTFILANPRAMTGAGDGGGGGEGEEIFLTKSVEATAPAAAFNLLNTGIARQVSLLHTKVFFFSEELAREGLGEWLAPLQRLREFRPSANVYVVRGNIRSFMEGKQSLLEKSPVKYYELINVVPQLNSFFLPTLFAKFYEEVKAPTIQATMPLISLSPNNLERTKPGPLQGGNYGVGDYRAGELPLTGPETIQFLGTGVFRGDRLVGELTGEETRFYLMLSGEYRRGLFNLPDPVAGYENYTGLDVIQGRKPIHRVGINPDGSITVDVQIFLESELVAVPSGVNYENPELKPLLENVLEDYVRQGCEDVIRRCQEEFRSEIFGFGYTLKRQFITWPQWEQFNWLERFPQSQVNITVHNNIRRTGIMRKTNPAYGR